jgi:acyl carrier protein
MASILERLKKVVAEQLDVDEKDVTPQTSFADDLGADSLDLVELITAVEEEFGSPDKKLEIADDDAEKLQSVQDAIDYLRDQGIAD